MGLPSLRDKVATKKMTRVPKQAMAKLDRVKVLDAETKQELENVEAM
jgi:hypothetical protein